MGTGNRPFFYLGDGMVQKIQTGYKLYIDIIKRIIAVFVAQGLSILGAGSLVGIDVYLSLIHI